MANGLQTIRWITGIIYVSRVTWPVAAGISLVVI
jgi:hypothetical protein